MSDVEDVFVELTDESGQIHNMKLLTIFEAGALNRKYGAFLTTDIVLYRYESTVVNGEMHECVFEISDSEFQSVSAAWDDILSNGDNPSCNVREGNVYMSVSDDEEIEIAGTILSVFPVNSSTYAAICPHAVHFYRYNEFSKDGEDYVEWTNIEIMQEYDDIATHFDRMLRAEMC